MGRASLGLELWGRLLASGPARWGLTVPCAAADTVMGQGKVVGWRGGDIPPNLSVYPGLFW